MAIEGSRASEARGRSGSAWSAAGRAPSSARVHRIAARLDGEYELVAGALSSDPARAKASAAELGLDPERSYGSFEEMAKAEAKRPDGIEAVAIVTPNHMHFGPAKAFLEAGIHVICDKPLTSTLADAKKLAALVEKSGKVFVLTHNYTGYPMVRQAREMVAEGRARQDPRRAGGVSAGLADHQHRGDRARSRRRGAPIRNRSGAGGSIGDIGTHAYNLARFVTGLELDALAADLDSFVEGRQLDDNAHIMLRFQGGAKGMIWASQVAPGHENGLKLRVYGEKGGLEWTQADPNYLWYTPFGEPKQLLTRGRRRRRSRCGPRQPRAVRPSRRLSRRLRQHLPGGRTRHPRGAQEEWQAAEGRDLPDRPGRRRGRGLRRGLRQIVEEERGVDETVGAGAHLPEADSRSCTIWH